MGLYETLTPRTEYERTHGERFVCCGTVYKPGVLFCGRCGDNLHDSYIRNMISYVESTYLGEGE